MKFTKVFSAVITLLTLCHSQGVTPRYRLQRNPKQTKLIEGCLNLQVDPCDDFYEYACGNWDQVYLGAGKNYYEALTMLDYNVNKEMSNLFNHFNMRKNPKFIQEAYNFYKSCESMSSYRSVEYLKWLKGNDGFKWPALWIQPNNRTVFNWVETLAKMRRYGLNNVFIQQIVMGKISDVKTFVIELDKPVKAEGFQPLTKKSLEVLMLSLPADISIMQLEKMWQEIQELEQKLEGLDEIEDTVLDNISDYEKERLIYIRDLPLDWLKKYVKILLNQTELNDNMQLYIHNIPYMKALDDLLKQYPQRFLCQYLEIRFLWHLHLDGPANFIDEDCLASTRSLLPVAMHWQYEQHHSEMLEEYPLVREIFNDMRKHFNNTVIGNKHGFNASIIQYLQSKINRMELRLNNVPRTDTVATLEKFYRNLNLDREQFYANHLKLLHFNFLARRNLLKNYEPILDYSYLEVGDTGSSSSPYFLQNYNTIFVPLTLLQYPIYSPGLHDVYKYSSLGFLLAHEMIHGFDDSGIWADENGNTKFIEFEENPIFNASFNCLYEINPNIVGEKIADISGLRFAYQAFVDSEPAALNRTILLHRKEFSLGKLFFLNFAQFFCGKSADEYVSLAEHGSDRDRLADALSHFPEFSKEFKCNSNHKLYPHETCHLWR